MCHPRETVTAVLSVVVHGMFPSAPTHWGGQCVEEQSGGAGEEVKWNVDEYLNA